jgi:hypothetical protein
LLFLAIPGLTVTVCQHGGNVEREEWQRRQDCPLFGMAITRSGFPLRFIPGDMLQYQPSAMNRIFTANSVTATADSTPAPPH